LNLMNPAVSVKADGYEGLVGHSLFISSCLLIEESNRTNNPVASGTNLSFCVTWDAVRVGSPEDMIRFVFARFRRGQHQVKQCYKSTRIVCSSLLLSTITRSESLHNLASLILLIQRALRSGDRYALDTIWRQQSTQSFLRASS
jgi:hypothetical protein